MDLHLSIDIIYSHVCLLVFMRFAFPFHHIFFHIFDDVTSRFCPTLVMFGLFFLGINSDTDSMYRLLLTTSVASFSWPLHPLVAKELILPCIVISIESTLEVFESNDHCRR
jgi:hypothetical protein